MYGNDWATGSAIRESLDKAEADARRAIVLAPDLGEGHMALAKYFASSLEFPLAMEEYEHALALAPGNARVLREYGRFAVLMGHTEQGLATVRRAIASDPLNSHSRLFLVETSMDAGRPNEAMAALSEARSIDPNISSGDIDYWLAMGYYFAGDFEKAREACDSAFEFDKADYISNLFCRAIIYQKLARHADAEVMFVRLQRPWPGSHSVAVWNAMIYSQWGDRRRALDWLETALREHDSGLSQLRTPWFDPLRNEPRFQAIERALKFPN